MDMSFCKEKNESSSGVENSISRLCLDCRPDTLDWRSAPSGCLGAVTNRRAAIIDIYK